GGYTSAPISPLGGGPLHRRAPHQRPSRDADTKPAVQDDFGQRHVICALDAFYEWGRMAGRRQPDVIGRADEEPPAFAGPWESWQPQDGRTAGPTADMRRSSPPPDPAHPPEISGPFTLVSQKVIH